ncbi:MULTISPECIES: hypothetical protein [Allobacillus]|uniref:Uncharacterized protein n=2 Tax=Allobacillus TaxID=1400133 RepID=A0A556PM64_9BACI|nr:MULTISPECIES: hypothetical protein [Allobacillus]MBU6081535.1 hypothetical protein [Allobacillus halotolerans]TSJ65477.1 hypothetical protein FPQ13_06635 [Allobacillus salarius]TSJ69443.1 hypothetical protein FPQ10_03090 [Allobacillus sp. SKP2-8]
MSVINIIGIILVIVLLALSLFNVSLSKIIIVLFISSLGLFVVRMTIENKDFLDAFINSFGLMTIISFVVVIVNFYKNRSFENSEKE